MPKASLAFPVPATPRRKARAHVPTGDEEAAIRRGIDADPDSPELGDDFFAKARPAGEVVPDVVEAMERRRRGRQRAPTKARKAGPAGAP